MAEQKKRDAVASMLRKNILSGRYGSEGGIPDETEISKSFGCSGGTVIAALTLLEGERLVVHRGKSYYVNALPLVMTQHVPSAHVGASKVSYVKNVGQVVRMNAIPEYMANQLDIPASTSNV